MAFEMSENNKAARVQRRFETQTKKAAKLGPDHRRAQALEEAA
jgi:hypothetical protein